MYVKLGVAPVDYILREVESIHLPVRVSEASKVQALCEAVECQPAPLDSITTVVLTGIYGECIAMATLTNALGSKCPNLVILNLSYTWLSQASIMALGSVLLQDKFPALVRLYLEDAASPQDHDLLVMKVIEAMREGSLKSLRKLGLKNTRPGGDGLSDRVLTEFALLLHHRERSLRLYRVTLGDRGESIFKGAMRQVREQNHH